MKNSRKETINGRKANEKITFQLTLSLADKEIKEKVEFNSKTTRYPMLYNSIFIYLKKVLAETKCFTTQY